MKRNLKEEGKQRMRNRQYKRPKWWPVRLPPGIELYPKGYVNLLYGGGELPTGVEMVEYYREDEMIREKVRIKLEKKKKFLANKQIIEKFDNLRISNN
jgi:hypothetical protein